MRNRFCLLLLGTVLSLTLSAARLQGQTSGVLRGTVKDPSGAIIPGARITVTNQQTNVAFKTTSDNSGVFIFPVLAVGAYSLRVEAEGFKTFVESGVEINIGHVDVENAVMTLGTVNQEVTTVASAPLVETTSTQLGHVEASREVVGLPLNTRNTYDLLQLQPGVSSTLGSALFYGGDQPGVVSVNGGRARMNNYMVNGGNANDQFVNLPGVQPTPDSIQEFRVITNNFDAEYGRNSGSVVNVVTKSGGNAFHGDLYDFLRNTGLDARPYFDPTVPQFVQNQFGGTFGGPIKKDKTFFFVSYEGLRLSQGISSQLVAVPTAAERGGDFSAGQPFAGQITDQNFANVLNARPGCAGSVAASGGAPIAPGTAYSAIFPNNVIPASCFDPTAVDLMNHFVPLPNSPGGNFQSSPLHTGDTNQINLKIDHRLSDKQQLSGYYYLDDVHGVDPFSFFQAAGANVPGFPDVNDSRFQQASLEHTWTTSPTMVNVARVAFFREAQGQLNHPLNTALVQNSCTVVPASQCFSDPANPALGITPGLGASREGVPFISVNGSFAIGNNFEGELPQYGNSFEYSDNLSKVIGNHTTKFGADIQRNQFNQTLYFNVSGDYTFGPGSPNDPLYNNAGGAQDFTPNYLLGIPSTYSQGSANHEYVRDTGVYLYAQDSWKMRHNLTFNYGLRWELDTPMADISHHVQTFRPGQNDTLYPCQLSANSMAALGLTTSACGPGTAGDSVFPTGLVIPGDKGVPAGLTQTYYKAFAPRTGLAWSPDWNDGILSKLSGGPGKTSVRMGWGIFYNPIEQLVLEQFSAEPPFGGSSSFSNTLFNTPFEAQNGTINPNPFHGILNPTPGTPVDWSSFRPILLFGQFQPNLRTQYMDQYNFTIERQIGDSMVLTMGYVGTQGHRLLASHDLNYGNSQTCLDLNSVLGAGTCGPYGEDSAYTIPAGAIPAGFTFHLPYGSTPTVTGPNTNPITMVGIRPFSSPNCQPLSGVGCPADGVPVFSNIFAEDTIANSYYNAAEVSLERHFSGGLYFNAAYTYSSCFDMASTFEELLNPLNFQSSYAPCLFNGDNRFVFSYVWDLPIPKMPGFAGKLLNGWGLSGITTYQTGFPIRITSADDTELMNSFFFLPVGEPNFTGPLQTMDPRAGSHYFFNPNQFSDAPLGVFGNSARSICCGPAINDTDIVLSKNTQISEKLASEFRFEVYNLFNTTQFLQPDGNFSDPTFGQSLNVRPPRLVQVALKLIF
jgi:hypothetical protein